MVRLFSSPALVFISGILLRIAFLVYGDWQDKHSPVKFTDIDYYVFTDAARFVSMGQSPYDRDTYRYTPLLAWMLLPTARSGALWFASGKFLFALSDIAASYFIFQILRTIQKKSVETALKFTSIWLLNPMVAIISTRGSSEGLLLLAVMALLWAVLQQRIRLAGCLLGLAIHLKIYPFIYAVSIFWWLGRRPHPSTLSEHISHLCSSQRVQLVVFSFVVFMILNFVMIYCYGTPFIEHTYLYHLSRTDHRHNFSPYNILLYLNSSLAETPTAKLRPESWAFLPQLSLAAFFIPLALAKKDLPATMLAQTFAFVAFNKVCTSQYFLWYMVFLPFYLPNSSLIVRPRLGMTALVLWIIGQALWLQQAYQLEFLGKPTFVPGLWLGTLMFFAINVWILGIIISDIRKSSTSLTPSSVVNKRVD